MEILDLYDDNFNKLDEIIVRGNSIPSGKNIMLVVVFIKNKDNKYLIQKTSVSKGGEYSTTGGHVLSSEDGETSIIREIKEELGIDVDIDELKHVSTIKYPSKPCIFNIYILDKDIDISKLVLQSEEVMSVEWLSDIEIEKLINDNNFLESHGYIFDNYIK